MADMVVDDSFYLGSRKKGNSCLYIRLNKKGHIGLMNKSCFDTCVT